MLRPEHTHELRYKGGLVGHYESRRKAEAARDGMSHFDSSTSDPENHDFHRAQFQIAPRRPFELFVNGAFVDTFDSFEEASARVEELGREAGRPFNVDTVQIVNREAGEEHVSEITTADAPDEATGNK
jgi:hypothetical protein